MGPDVCVLKSLWRERKGRDLHPLQPERTGCCYGAPGNKAGRSRSLGTGPLCLCTLRERAGTWASLRSLHSSRSASVPLPQLGGGLSGLLLLQRGGRESSSLFLGTSRALRVPVLPPNPVLAARWVPATAPRSAVSSLGLGRLGLLCAPPPGSEHCNLSPPAGLSPAPPSPGPVSPAPQLWAVCLAPALPRSLTLGPGLDLSPRPGAVWG